MFFTFLFCEKGTSYTAAVARPTHPPAPVEQTPGDPQEFSWMAPGEAGISSTATAQTERGRAGRRSFFDAGTIHAHPPQDALQISPRRPTPLKAKMHGSVRSKEQSRAAEQKSVLPINLPQKICNRIGCTNLGRPDGVVPRGSVRRFRCTPV